MIPSSALGANRLRKNMVIGDDETVAPRPTATGPSPPSRSGQLQVTSASGMALQLRERCGDLLVTGCVQSAAASPLEPAVRCSACPGGVGNSEDGRPKPKSEDAGGDSSSSFLRWLDRQGCGVENDLLQRISLHGPVQTVPLGQSQAHPPVRHSIPRRPDSSIGADGYRPNPAATSERLLCSSRRRAFGEETVSDMHSPTRPITAVAAAML